MITCSLVAFRAVLAKNRALVLCVLGYSTKGMIVS